MKIRQRKFPGRRQRREGWGKGGKGEMAAGGRGLLEVLVPLHGASAIIPPALYFFPGLSVSSTLL